MVMSAKEIVKYLSSESVHPMRLKELAKALNVSNREYSRFRLAVKELVDAGRLVRLKRGRIGPPDQLNVIVGDISINRSGTGFLAYEGGDEDLVIRTYDLLTALDGDRVMVRRKGTSGGRPSGQVIKIIERPKRNIVGVFHKTKNLSYVVPDNPRLHRHLMTPPGATKRARDGEKVVAVLVDWDDPSQNPEGKVIERLGFPGEPGVDMLSILRNYDYTTEFPPKVLSEGERSAAKDIKKEIARRVDFTGEQVYTIDPVDAKDFDDAVSVVSTKNGYRLSVHIADVAFFIKEGGALDREAFERGNSVYLPGMVIPMLPEVLSNDVCSLRPDRIRLTHSVVMDFDRTGKMVKWKVVDGVIKSQARLTYEEVEQFLDSGRSSNPKIKELEGNLSLAAELASLLTKRRMEQGALDFSLPEPLLELNDKGEVLRLGLKKRLKAHRLVEEFMLMANQAVALELFRKGLSTLYRVHAKPEMEKLEAFSEMMNRFGHRFPVSPTIKPIQLARFLEKVAGKPEEGFVNELLLRSMQKAVYQRENLGHFGLAFTHYSHFTSPIRRYPDLVVHRLIRQAVNGKYPAPFAKRVNSIIDTAGQQCSETERKAVRAERDAIKIKQLEYMERHIGDELAGMITGVMPFGFFVRLVETGVEGLIRLSSIDDDYYAYDEKMHQIVGRRTARRYRLGDQVQVKLARVDRLAGDMDLWLMSGPPAGKSGGGQRRSPRKDANFPPVRVSKSKKKDKSRKNVKGKKKVKGKRPHKKERTR